MPGYSLIEDVADRVKHNLGHAIEHYAALRILDGSPTLAPGEFLDDAGALGRQHGLTGIFLWDYFLERVNAANDDTGQLVAAGNYAAYLKRLIAALPSAETGDELAAGKFLDWSKLQTEYKISTSKRCLYILTLKNPAEVGRELSFLCDNSCKTGALAGWRTRLAPHLVGTVEPMLTAYVLSAISSAISLHSAYLKENHAEELKIVASAARVIWIEYEKITNIHNTANSFRSDLALRRLFLLNTYYTLLDIGILDPAGNGNQAGKASIVRNLSSIIESVYISSQFDPIHIGSDLTYYFKDESVDIDRYIRINADVLLLEAMIAAYGANSVHLKKPECKRLIDRVTFPFQETFKEDANGQRLAIYAAYHCVRVLDILRITAQRTEDNWFRSAVANIRYYWAFRRGFLIDIAWAIGAATIAGILLSFAAVAPTLWAGIVPFTVLAITSLLRAFGTGRTRQ